MRNVLEAGFVFWGLFLVFALILVAYVLWMVWEEGRTPGGEMGKPQSPEAPE